MLIGGKRQPVSSETWAQEARLASTAFLKCLLFFRGGEGFESQNRNLKSAKELGFAPQPRPAMRTQAEEHIQSQNSVPRWTSQRRNDAGELIHSLLLRSKASPTEHWLGTSLA